MSVNQKIDIEIAKLTVISGGAAHDVLWPSGKSLVEAMMDQNLSPPFSCLVGKCGACVCTLVEGSVTMANNEVLDEADIAENYILGCQARPTSDIVAICFD